MSRGFATIVIVFLALSPQLGAEEAFAWTSVAEIPVREVTVFKDGHAFLLHEGRAEMDEKGRVVLDYLPKPVIGTFWPYSAAPDADLKSVTAGRHRVSIERTALNFRELLEGNIGAEIVIEESNGTRYAATIMAIPSRSSAELIATSAPGSGEPLPTKGNLIHLETIDGVKVVGIDSIQRVTFKEPPSGTVASEEFRNVLTLQLDRHDTPRKEAQIGMVYLQRGIRWIPNYKIVLDGEGRARVQLQATILNEITDLEDVTVHLVVGVPHFAFKDTIDPIALQESAAQLSQYFHESARTAYAFSNAIMTQAARMSDYRGRRGGSGGSDDTLGPKVSELNKNEDLFVFTIEHLTLQQGERMVVPVAEFDLDYDDVYVLDLPIAPPPDMRRNLSDQQQRELARLFHAPKVMHKIRLANGSPYPLTTAPALLLNGKKLLGQGMMTYTAQGGKTEVDITTAIDIRVETDSVEELRTPNAEKWGGNSFHRVDIKGTISLTNYLDKAIQMEVKRVVAGFVDSAGHEGKFRQFSFYDVDRDSPWWNLPHWWGWYSWPHWWSRMNSTGRIDWTVSLEPGAEKELEYNWHYFWR